jgi:hypothetical protein
VDVIQGKHDDAAALIASNPAATSLPYTDIKKRWDTTTTTADFEKWAENQALASGSLMDALSGRAAAAAPKNLAAFAALETQASVPVAQLAQLLKAEPTHPLAAAIKLWGDDEQRFSKMMMEDTAEALEWRQTMEAVLAKIQPVKGEPVLYRGWKFKTAAELQAFMEEHQDGFVQKRSGMSASLDPSVAAREKFSGGPHSMIWVLQGNRSAVDARPLFQALNAVAHSALEEEAIVPVGVIFRWVDREGLEQVQDSAGTPRRLRVFILQEEKL